MICGESGAEGAGRVEGGAGEGTSDEDAERMMRPMQNPA